jgi:hypothetical protein
MPVANLQVYRTVALRVQSAPYAQYQAYSLEQTLTGALRQTCGFEAIGPSTGAPVDLALDVTITGAGRGGAGWIKNNNLATLDTLLVLTDGQSGELLGSARIHGQSSQIVTNGETPEQQAVGVVAKTVVDLLGKSGCSGPRVARAPVAPPPANPPANPPAEAGKPDYEAHRAEADQLNEQGKAKVRTAELDAAVQLFEQANALAPDPRYVYNTCLAYEAAEKWDNALASCKQARGMSPKPELVQKIDHRIELLQHHQ